MAKIEFVHPPRNNIPGFIETLEVRVWGRGGTASQPFYLGSGLNFRADGNFWLEIMYSVEGARIFYTRNFLHRDPSLLEGHSSDETLLDELVARGEGVFDFGDILPETSLALTLKKYIYTDENQEEKQSTSDSLKVSADTSAVFRQFAPGDRSLDIVLQGIDRAESARFMRDLIHEIEAARQGKHPDPARFPAGSSEWPFIWQLNQKAHHKISEDDQDACFENPRLAQAFDGWLAQLPPGGSVLDAGCGRGNPAIRRMLEQGFQVTGSDFSPDGLRVASQQFPQARFIQQATTQITDRAAYDGVCSFNALLYLDPIDLLHSIYRLYHALRPGGLLFLYALDSGPDWRGEPFRHSTGQWVWSWHYDMGEAASLLEEHGYFNVLETRIMKRDEAEVGRAAQETGQPAQGEAAGCQRQDRLPFMPTERAPYAYVIIARRGKA